MFFEENFILQFYKARIHLLHQGVYLYFVEGETNSLQDSCLDLGFEPLNIINWHVIHIVVIPKQIVHEFSQLTACHHLRQPFGDVFSLKENLPSMQKTESCFIFIVKALLILIISHFKLGKDFVVLGFLLHFFIHQNHLFKSHFLLIKPMG